MVRPEGYKRILDDGFIYYFMFPVKKPGGYQYRVAIRDTQGGKTGSCKSVHSGSGCEERPAYNFEPGHRKSHKAGMGQADGSESARNVEFFAGHRSRRIRSGTVLRYALEAYNAKLDANRRPAPLQTRIRVFQDGKLILDGKPVSVDLAGQTDMQRIAVSGAMSLIRRCNRETIFFKLSSLIHLQKKSRRSRRSMFNLKFCLKSSFRILIEEPPNYVRE